MSKDIDFYNTLGSLSGIKIIVSDYMPTNMVMVNDDAVLEWHKLKHYKGIINKLTMDSINANKIKESLNQKEKQDGK